MSSFRILDDFRKKKIHIEFVVNEHGGTEGLITLHDLVEDIIGDLPEGEKQVIRRPDGSLLVDGAVNIEEIQSVLELTNMVSLNYKTLSDFIIYKLQSSPKTGISFKFSNYRFKIVDMDGLIIDKVLIRKY